MALTPEEVKSFHSIDRKLFTKLVKNLRQDLAPAMKVIALWYWMETIGFRNIIFSLLTINEFLLQHVFVEALNCINFIEAPSSDATQVKMPLMSIMIRKEIPALFFYVNKFRALNGITKTIDNLLIRAFSDIIEDVYMNTGHEMLKQGDVNPCGESTRKVQYTKVGLSNAYYIPPNERTMFVTFSRGYPLSPNDVLEFFMCYYGNCVESIQMQNVPPGQQPLYALVVLHDASTIPTILHGKKKLKFSIKGKHIWMRRFIAKRNKPKQV